MTDSALDRTVSRSCSLFDLPAAQFDLASLDQLAQAMALATLPASRTPSGYVYLGQFIGHDLSLLDSSQAAVTNVSDVRQLRAPALNLENVYGQGFDDPALAVDRDTGYLELGRTLTESGEQGSFDDLPRHENSIAHIPDDRDEENLLIGQLHVVFIKLHNFFCTRLNERMRLDAEQCFYAARRQLILHYQEVVLYDFLRAVIDSHTWNSVVEHQELVLWDSRCGSPARMPVEFAAAAFRFGHSMVRQHYSLNHRLPMVSLPTLFGMTAHGRIGRTQRALSQSHVVDWRLFFPIEAKRDPRFMNFAMRIDPAVSIKAPPDGSALSAKTFRTGVRCLLPNAQSIVARLHDQHADLAIDPLTAEELSPEIHVIEKSSVRKAGLLELSSRSFESNTPLAYYLLAEAHARRDGLQLGPLGSRIVAEVLWGLTSASNPSVLHEKRNDRFIRATGYTSNSGPTYLRMSDLLGSIA
ncbi:MAG: peroxidase family protein [Povalibacter sp.]